MTKELNAGERRNLFNYVVRIADDSLILGHRLSEWCGHAPILEEDIALANIALDCIGQANAFLKLASEIEGTGRSEDDLAFFREAVEFKNLLLVEQPNQNFAVTIVRQFFMDVFKSIYFDRLRVCSFKPLADISEKAIKETAYHLRHSRNWLLRLGDGTEESNKKTQDAVFELWRFIPEIFNDDEVDNFIKEHYNTPLLNEIETEWFNIIKSNFNEAGLIVPEISKRVVMNGRKGIHSEHLGHLLAEMQITARSFPGAKW